MQDTTAAGLKAACTAKASSNSKLCSASKGGDEFEGQFNMGVITGKGTLKFKSHPSFISYTGNWKTGAFEGWGTLLLKQDESYIGEWSAGERNGIGMFQFAKTSPYRTYKGQWKNDEFSGIGCLTL